MPRRCCRPLTTFLRSRRVVERAGYDYCRPFYAANDRDNRNADNSYKRCDLTARAVAPCAAGDEVQPIFTTTAHRERRTETEWVLSERLINATAFTNNNYSAIKYINKLSAARHRRKRTFAIGHKHHSEREGGHKTVVKHENFEHKEFGQVQSPVCGRENEARGVVMHARRINFIAPDAIADRAMSRDSYELNSRLSRGGSLFGTDPQVQLRTALRNDDYVTFKKLVNYGAVDLEHVYQYPDYKTCLEIAISELNKQDYIKLLLQHEVQVNKINETLAAAPIHLAVESGNIEALKALLDDDRIDVNIRSKGNTALLLAIKKIEDLEEDRENDLGIYEDMVELLLKSGCDANAPDLKGITPVYSAAKQGLERVISLILDYTKKPIDLDTYKDRRGKTARYYLKEAFPHLLAKFDAAMEIEQAIDNDKLFHLLSRHEEDEFIRNFNILVKKNDHRSALAANNGISTMLQMATEKGMEKAVSTLLTAGADPNATSPGNTSRPIAIACQNGFSKILKMFIDHESTLLDVVNGDSMLQLTIKGMKGYSNNPKSDYKTCLDILLRHPKLNVNVNYCDIKDNTALHYAGRNGDSETVLELLRHGACVGLRNKFNEPPLADINAKTLETYLDECLTTNGERSSDDDYEIHMKYSFLVYPNNSLENELCKVPLMNNNNNKECDTLLAPETDALLYMTRNEELKPLLKHPVITSFLYLKWQRISCLFYANITFYSLLWLCLILYILLGYGVEDEQTSRTNGIKTLNVITRVGVVIGLILLIFRELFQMLVSPIRYLKSFENLMEIALIVVTAWIVCTDSDKESPKQQLSAVAILLSSAELVLLIGQFPSLSTNIVMLRTVSWNFFKFILWYCILIIAFALSFYTLFRKAKEDKDQKAPDPNKTGNDEEEEEDFFEDPGRSLFKTIVMLTGEFDAGSIKFSTFPFTSHVIFIVFVFMIPIVLFNLLNGLAVSDTQEIRADAELVGHISRIKLISYFESVIVGNGKAYAKPRKESSWFPWKFDNLTFIKPSMFCIKPFAKRVSLFPHFLPKYKIIVKPNQGNKIEIPHPEPLGKFGDDYDDIEQGPDQPYGFLGFSPGPRGFKGPPANSSQSKIDGMRKNRRAPK
ncbi:Transient receptor potential cation channel protein painless [Eumeta japonica]|uniref:Transient receptor potential cation channel protein painless n=1 Tax=Eumeta variegata TaxID=151549 RepID=A0A4C1SXL4_EUMVA|nr:Transient receptor potential cation channel protein painless [Eumeta japonica]